MAVFNLVSFDLQGVEDSVICQHMAAVHFYTDSIEKKIAIIKLINVTH